MSKRKPIIGGNWKMNTDLASGMNLASCIVDEVQNDITCDVVLYPPFPYLQAIESVVSDSPVMLGAQNMWHEPEGAFTGETSASMLQEVGVRSVLIGHSERRHILGETDELIAQKVSFGLSMGFQIVLCVGETIEQREEGNTLDVVLSQVSKGLDEVDGASMSAIVIAYEPVWAIGTGKTATPDDAQAVHASIRQRLEELYDSDIAQQTRIQYGGSVKPENAAELFSCEDIDGALVGGASLSAESFTAIVMATQQS